MHAIRARFLSTLVLSLGVPGIFLGVGGPVAAADPGVTEAAADYGGGCALYPDNRAATIDALRFRCGPEQQDAIFRDAPRGAVPTGVKDGWVTRPPSIQGISSAFWIGKIFYTGPDGGTLTNRVTGAGYEAWPAYVYTAPALLDGNPAWALDYAPAPTPQVYDEIREVTPGVWFGYSWWRGGVQTTMLLTFVLT
ncbi:hypothetical protein [Nocardia brasiliensis]|uniref:hypothetical protein n=1 Tax=Nocardia brasiliensis TaxID=37326 RepID=UPI0004A6B72C|nr:hypothetical protein [Nocardia brasiliensis]MBF6128996.1 hypothetical protein [Nocardia brasiliensis]MBF6545736.1 hypothetical protein [Nocardia brasiliensis]